ncbi:MULTISPECIES: WecB/TagA/CpsF family glycosyltransferase [Bacillus cereus group]|uniref:WecB/TagA/CpsF family glycosyltransferase n=1 Tax=Bacillus cereus group TaxID=86661 RepID=UPI0020C00AB6|nr:WecB/TagA/CpsF family glycosyltransferase [Bacillus cereus]
MKVETVKLFNVDFSNLSMNETINCMEKIIETNKKNNMQDYVVTPNVDHIVNVHKDSSFREIYKGATLTLVDGAPIFMVSKKIGTPLKEKVSGSDLTPHLFELAQRNNYKVFIFGSREGVPDLAIQKIRSKYGYTFPIESYSPPFGFEKQPDVLGESIKKIQGFQPDILLVSLGSPKGERFIYENLKELNVPISLQIGASIDFIAGTVKRAPIWMQKVGLEWFYRFLQEPKRMFRRYFINDSYFLVLVFKEFFKRRRGQ